MTRRTPPYIAIARSLIHDKRFRGPADRRFTTLEATIWLIEAAAWKPRGQATRFGAVHNDRGQLSTTERALAREWGWSKTGVRRFLQGLVEDGTLTLQLARCGPKSGPKPFPQSGYARTLITLCNYDKFQPLARGIATGPDQKADQNHDHDRPELPGLIYAIASETKQTDESVKESAHLTKPGHASVSRDEQWVWYDYGSGLWQMWAESYQRAHSAAILPENRRGGRGNWFFKAGEALRPKRRRTRA